MLMITTRTTQQQQQLFEKINKIVYLIFASVSNSGNLRTAYKKNAELSIEVKPQWQAEAVYTLPVIISATGVIPHTLLDVFK